MLDRGAEEEAKRRVCGLCVETVPQFPARLIGSCSLCHLWNTQMILGHKNIQFFFIAAPLEIHETTSATGNRNMVGLFTDFYFIFNVYLKCLM